MLEFKKIRKPIPVLCVNNALFQACQFAPLTNQIGVYQIK